VNSAPATQSNNRAFSSYSPLFLLHLVLVGVPPCTVKPAWIGPYAGSVMLESTVCRARQSVWRAASSQRVATGWVGAESVTVPNA